MNYLLTKQSFVTVSLMLVLFGCAGTPQVEAPIGGTGLYQVASSDRQWTGVAVSREGRVFVCYPRWGDEVPFAVGEVHDKGKVSRYLGKDWNTWDLSMSPEDHFVCVQSVYADWHDFLWILDPASPSFEGVVPGGAKLVKVDLRRDEVVDVMHFGEDVAPEKSYLNDIRVDVNRRFGYITDSGLGAIIVVDFARGTARRVLDGHPSTSSEGITLTIDGEKWLRPDGGEPEIHSDGIALDWDGGYLYYQALTGKTLYRIQTQYLRDPNISPEDLGEKVEVLAETGPADGILAGTDGWIYLSALEDNAVKRYNLKSGEVETVVESSLLAWPDTFSRAPENWIYVTTSQIHRMPDPADPYRLFKFRTP
jgi:sugar lactone lactonase YvrE